MSKVGWICKKPVDFELIQKLLQRSIELNQMTNGGPLIGELERFLRQELEIKDDRCVIVAVNGALALHTLVNGINLHLGKQIRYATQAFTFPCSAQGPCQDSYIIDIDPVLYCLNLNEIPADADGIIVTNLFGNVSPIDNFLQWQKDEVNDKCRKILLFDNATVPFSTYRNLNVNNYGDGCIISLHHSKIFGYSEGGIIIAKKEYEESIRKCLNFGFSVSKGVVNWSNLGNNAKMSEVSAAFILGYLSQIPKRIKKHQIQIYQEFKKKLEPFEPEVKLFPHFDPLNSVPFVSCFALIFRKKITNDDLQTCELSGITSRKYYTPLNDSPIAKYLFEHILCLPCHLEVDVLVLDRYISLIKSLIQ